MALTIQNFSQLTSLLSAALTKIEQLKGAFRDTDKLKTSLKDSQAVRDQQARSYHLWGCVFCWWVGRRRRRRTTKRWSVGVGMYVFVCADCTDKKKILMQNNPALPFPLLLLLLFSQQIHCRVEKTGESSSGRVKETSHHFK